MELNAENLWGQATPRRVDGEAQVPPLPAEVLAEDGRRLEEVGEQMRREPRARRVPQSFVAQREAEIHLGGGHSRRARDVLLSTVTREARWRFEEAGERRRRHGAELGRLGGERPTVREGDRESSRVALHLDTKGTVCGA